MSEKRKPTVKLVAEIHGKRMRIELFPGSLWPEKFRCSDQSKYRVRVNGKWQHGEATFTMSEIVRQLRKWMTYRIKKRPAATGSGI